MTILHKCFLEIHEKGIQQDLVDNGKENIIKRELANHECEYTGCIDDVVEKLEDYRISREEIQKVFKG